MEKPVIYELAVKSGEDVETLTRAWNEICRQAGIKGRVRVIDNSGLFHKIISLKEDMQYGGKEDANAPTTPRG